MKKGYASASSLIHAPAAHVYSILADYHQGHPAIVPKKYFRKVEVEEGGRGAGTKLLVEMRVMGSTYVSHHVVSEPEPGRVLLEENTDCSTKTTFTVDPNPGGATCTLRIETEFSTRPGILGSIQRAVTRSVLVKIYKEELGNIKRYVGEASRLSQ